MDPMRPQRGEVLHFSEDPTIELFRPHVARTAQQPEAYVWAVDHGDAPSYWFPRDCPRGMAWRAVDGSTTEADAALVLGPHAPTRVHAIEYGWLDALRATRLYAYRFDAVDFRPFGTPIPHAMVCTHDVRPVARPDPVPDLVALHDEAGIELRVVTNLWPWWDQVVASTCGFSGIRLANATPRP